jgi:hypothetical protein
VLARKLRSDVSPANSDVEQGSHSPLPAWACVMTLVLLTMMSGDGARKALTAAEKAACRSMNAAATRTATQEQEAALSAKTAPGAHLEASCKHMFIAAWVLLPACANTNQLLLLQPMQCSEFPILPKLLLVLHPLLLTQHATVVSGNRKDAA